MQDVDNPNSSDVHQQIAKNDPSGDFFKMSASLINQLDGTPFAINKPFYDPRGQTDRIRQYTSTNGSAATVFFNSFLNAAIGKFNRQIAKYTLTEGSGGKMFDLRHGEPADILGRTREEIDAKYPGVR
jgi:hypothetical protein